MPPKNDAAYRPLRLSAGLGVNLLYISEVRNLSAAKTAPRALR